MPTRGYPNQLNILFKNTYPYPIPQHIAAELRKKMEPMHIRQNNREGLIKGFSLQRCWENWKWSMKRLGNLRTSNVRKPVSFLGLERNSESELRTGIMWMELEPWREELQWGRNTCNTPSPCQPISCKFPIGWLYPETNFQGTWKCYFARHSSPQNKKQGM